MYTRVVSVITVLLLSASLALCAAPAIISNFHDGAWTNMTVDRDMKRHGEASGRWDTAEKYRVIQDIGQDWTDEDFVDLWVHCPRACDTELWVKCHYSGTNALRYEPITGPHEPRVASLAFFEDGVAPDTISWPEETIRCHQSVDDRWEYIESEQV